jgi:hypothetical protein
MGDLARKEVSLKSAFEPLIRVLVGKQDKQNTVHTAIIPLAQMPVFESEGWLFVLADPDDVSGYVSWLRNRDVDSD